MPDMRDEIIHELPVETDGCTHVREHRFILDRPGRTYSVELTGGRLVGGEFHPVRASGRETQMEVLGIGPELFADFEAFCEGFESDPEEEPRTLPRRSAAALLAYLVLVQAGERPLPEPPALEE